MDFLRKRQKKLFFNDSNSCQDYLMSTNLRPQSCDYYRFFIELCGWSIDSSRHGLTWQCMVPEDSSNCYNAHCSMMEEGDEEGRMRKRRRRRRRRRRSWRRRGRGSWRRRRKNCNYWSIRATCKLGRIGCLVIIWHKKKWKLPPWLPKWQLLIYNSYRDGSKYMGFLTLFATRAGVSCFAAFCQLSWIFDKIPNQLFLSIQTT